MWPYLGVFLASLAVDCVPFFAPPAWTVMVFFVAKFDLAPWPVAAIGAAGSTIGRFLLSRVIPVATMKVFNKKEHENIEFLGKKLGGKPRPAFIFTLLYSLTPLSTTALFTAAGIARVKPGPILVAFFIGKFISDAVMILAGKNAVTGIKDLFKGQADPKSVVFLALGLLMVAALLFVDWRELLQRKRLRLDFHVLK
jgi:membrane protein YqaA with SNARE-associated domain